MQHLRTSQFAKTTLLKFDSKNMVSQPMPSPTYQICILRLTMILWVCRSWEKQTTWKRWVRSGMTISPFILLICLDGALCRTHQIDAFENQPPEHLGQDITLFIKRTSISHTISLFIYIFFLAPLQISHLIISSLGGGHWRYRAKKLSTNRAVCFQRRSE